MLGYLIRLHGAGAPAGALFNAVFRRRMTLSRRPLYFGIRPLVGSQRRGPFPFLEQFISVRTPGPSVKTRWSRAVHFFVYPVPSGRVLGTERRAVLWRCFVASFLAFFFVVFFVAGGLHCKSRGITRETCCQDIGNKACPFLNQSSEEKRTPSVLAGGRQAGGSLQSLLFASFVYWKGPCTRNTLS